MDRRADVEDVVTSDSDSAINADGSWASQPLQLIIARLAVVDDGGELCSHNEYTKSHFRFDRNPLRDIIHEH